MAPLCTSNFFRDDFMTNVLFSISPFFFPSVFRMPIFCHVNVIYFKYMTMNSNQLFFPFGNLSYLSEKILFPKYSRLLLLWSTLQRFEFLMFSATFSNFFSSRKFLIMYKVNKQTFCKCRYLPLI